MQVLRNVLQVRGNVLQVLHRDRGSVVDHNAYSAQQLHRQRDAELARVNELRRRGAERASVLDRSAVPATAPETAGRWRRVLIRWHLAPKLAH